MKPKLRDWIIEEIEKVDRSPINDLYDRGCKAGLKSVLHKMEDLFPKMGKGVISDENAPNQQS